MKIPVIFADGNPGVVNAEDLELLIQKRGIFSFQRSDVWVRVGFDALRDSDCYKKYYGFDRRTSGN